MRQKFKTTISRMALTLLGFFISLILVEFTLRLLDFPEASSIPILCQPLVEAKSIAHNMSSRSANYSPYSIHALCSEEFNVSYTMDSLGYLGIQKPKPEEHSLLVIGDSFAFGYGVDPPQNFASLIEAYNAGLWGQSYPRHAQVFEKIVDTIKPRRVIWILYPPHLITVSNNGWNTRQIDFTSYPWLNEVIGLYNSTRISTVILMSTGWGVNRGNYFTKEWALYDQQDQSVELGYSAFENAVVQITELAKIHDIQVIPVFVPSKRSLALELEGQRPWILHAGRPLMAELPIHRMAEVLHQHGILYEQHINLSDIFNDGLMDWRDLYFIKDSHWNSDGHKAVAEHLRERLLLGQSIE